MNRNLLQRLTNAQKRILSAVTALCLSISTVTLAIANIAGSTLAAPVEYETRIIYASRVVSFTPGVPWATDANAMDPNAALGPPDYRYDDDGSDVTLGVGGILILGFDHPFSDCEGDDVYVYETSEPEPYKVEISNDLVNWIPVGTSAGENQSFDLKVKVNPNDTFQYVKITDLSEANNGRWPGADIDAVGVKVQLPVSGKTDGLQVDLLASLPGGSTVQEGDVITYSIKVTNTATTTTGSIEIWDEVPAGLTYVPNSMVTVPPFAAQTSEVLRDDTDDVTLHWILHSISPGESVTVQFQTVVKPLPPGILAREFQNFALVQGNRTDGDVHIQMGHHFNGHIYRAFDMSLTWHEAKAYCEGSGGHLATITSQEEQDFIEQLLQEGTKNCYWLGATDEKIEGQWEWVTGEPFTYTNWRRGQPDNTNGIEHYLMIYRVNFPLGGYPGTWNDIAQDGVLINERNGEYYTADSYGFICEWDFDTTELGTDTAIQLSGTTYSGEVGEEITISGTVSSSTLTASSATIKWGCSASEAVTFGQMLVVGPKNITSISIPVTLNKAGTYTITVSTMDGASATAVLDISEVDGYYLKVFATSRDLVIGVGDSFNLIYGLFENDVLVKDWGKIAFVIGNNQIISITDPIKMATDFATGYSIRVIGLNEGISSLTMTDSESGAYVTVYVTVRNETFGEDAYRIDKVPSFYPNAYGEVALTNFYNYHGLYVNNYVPPVQTSNGYIIKFDVYNQSHMHGAVDIYDENGKWIKSIKLKKYTNISSFWDTGAAIYYMYKDTKNGRLLSYSSESFSSWTHVQFTVPHGGHFTISNNYVQSPGTYLYNSMDLLMFVVKGLMDVAVGDIKTDMLLDEIVKQAIERPDFYKIFLDSISDIALTASENALVFAYGLKAEAITIRFVELLDRVGISWKGAFETVIGVDESIFLALAGPPGIALKGMFTYSKIQSNLTQIIHLCQSIEAPFITIHAPSAGSMVVQGVTVTPEANALDPEAVLQVFRVVNEDVIYVNLNGENRKTAFYEYELYNISFTKDGKETQPNGKVIVKIPIPSGYPKDKCSILRQERDRSWTILDTWIEGDYLVFETTHFSYYAIVNTDSSNSPTYIVTFNPNGGNILPTSITVSNGGTYATLPTPTRNGHTFDGWYTAASGGTKVNLTDTVNLTGNITLYAHWTATASTTYTLTVVSGTGGGSYAVGSTVTITANATPTGKVFDKWTATSGSFANANNANTTFTMPAGSATVTATYKDVPSASANKPPLSDRIEAISDTLRGNYSDVSWSTFQSALSSARLVLNDTSATQAQIDSALSVLNAAFAGLHETSSPQPPAENNNITDQSTPNNTTTPNPLLAGGSRTEEPPKTGSSISGIMAALIIVLVLDVAFLALMAYGQYRKQRRRYYA